MIYSAQHGDLKRVMDFQGNSNEDVGDFANNYDLLIYSSFVAIGK